MRKILLLIIFFSSTTTIIFSQSIRITGRLLDKEDLRSISNGIVLLDPGNKTTITDQNGGYSFSCSIGPKQISARVLGYQSTILKFIAKSDTVINIYLDVLPFELLVVTVTGEQERNITITPHGNIVITPSAMRETPKLFSEPDLLKSFQLMPGVLAGKEGSSDIYVRGGGAGQNIIMANGCYFFLPSHFLGMISPIDLDFLENSELFKDFFPAELGGGASSIISLRFKESESDTLHAQLRLGMLSSGITAGKNIPKLDLNISAGLKRGNYSIYTPILKWLGSEEIVEFLPSDKYAFYDVFTKIGHSSNKIGKIDYLFFGSYDKGDDENEITSKNADTVIFNLDRISTGWQSVVHAIQWELPQRIPFRWRLDLNYNRLQMERELFHQTERHALTKLVDINSTTYSFSPIVTTIGSDVIVSSINKHFPWTAGISGKIKSFSPNIISEIERGDQEIKHKIGGTTRTIESAAFFSLSYDLTDLLQLDAGIRLTNAYQKKALYMNPEPRLRLSYNLKRFLSPHSTYVRLSQFDHSVESSSTGLRTMLWVPVSKEFGPEKSDVVSAGFQGHIKNNIVWSLNGYLKKIKDMVDYKSGASFVYDTTFAELLESINGRAYGVEAGIIKSNGDLTGSISYTWSRSKREFYKPEGLIWIPSSADRPHNVSMSIKYHLQTRTSFGVNWVYQSGAPATIYEQEASYGEFYTTKNNIRYFDYHRMDVSLRQIIPKRNFSILIDLDVYNVYNRKNTFYFKKIFDWIENSYYYKNICLFPIMPSITISIVF
jgi:hypothetical protein